MEGPTGYWVASTLHENGALTANKYYQRSGNDFLIGLPVDVGKKQEAKTAYDRILAGYEYAHLGMSGYHDALVELSNYQRTQKGLMEEKEKLKKQQEDACAESEKLRADLEGARKKNKHLKGLNEQMAKDLHSARKTKMTAETEARNAEDALAEAKTALSAIKAKAASVNDQIKAALDAFMISSDIQEYVDTFAPDHQAELRREIDSVYPGLINWEEFDKKRGASLSEDLTPDDEAEEGATAPTAADEGGGGAVDFPYC